MVSQTSSELRGTVVSVEVAPGTEVRVGSLLALVESMKLHHPDVSAASPRADLAEVLERHRIGRDEARPAAVQRRRQRDKRTARENLADLVEPISFVEYGPLVIAAQRRRRELDDLIANTPADGLVGGIGDVNADLFPGHARCAVASYDYTVLAGTQGTQNHRKKDRLFDVAGRLGLPVVFFTEGGGGRPGDTDAPGSVGSTVSRSSCSPSSRGASPSSASRRATASRATLRSSDAATS